jgi:hypothetical protein
MKDGMFFFEKKNQKTFAPGGMGVGQDKALIFTLERDDNKSDHEMVRLIV